MNYTTEQLVEIARQHEEHFTSITNWNRHAKLYNLPLDSTYRSRFGSWSESHVAIFGKYEIPKIYNTRKYSKEDLIRIARENREYFKSTLWPDHARKNGLPSRSLYYLHFGSWIESVTHIFGEYKADYSGSLKRYTLEGLEKTALENLDFFTTKRKWDAYALENSLPMATNYTRYFGSWDKAKQIFELKETMQKQKRMSQRTDKNGLSEIAHKYSTEFTTYENWADFAAKNDLPSSATFSRHFGSWNEAKEEIGISDVTYRYYTGEDLIEIALEHSGYFTNKKVWDAYASENNLPVAYTYRKRFNSWSQAKAVVREELRKHVEHGESD